MSYSKYDLLGQEYGNNIFSKTFLQRIRNHLFDFPLDIPIPYQTYKEAEIVCMGIEEETEQKFTSNDLLEMLVENFISYIRLNPNPQKVHNVLTQYKESPLIINFYNQEPVVVAGKMIKNVFFMKVELTKTELLSFEHMLDNIHKTFEEKYTVEEVIGFLFIDFFVKYDRGESEKTIKDIVRRLRGIDNVTNINEKKGWVNHGSYWAYGNSKTQFSKDAYEKIREVYFD